MRYEVLLNVMFLLVIILIEITRILIIKSNYKRKRRITFSKVIGKEVITTERKEKQYEDFKVTFLYNGEKHFLMDKDIFKRVEKGEYIKLLVEEEYDSLGNVKASQILEVL